MLPLIVESRDYLIASSVMQKPASQLKFGYIHQGIPMVHSPLHVAFERCTPPVFKKITPQACRFIRFKFNKNELLQKHTLDVLPNKDLEKGLTQCLAA